MGIRLRSGLQAQRTRDNTQGAQEEAAKYLRTPYKEAGKEAV